MRIELNYKSGQSPYLQIVEQIKYAVAAGSIESHDPLPSIRSLAQELRINHNTVAKAYTELERSGIIATRAGKGCYVTENHSPLKKSARRQILSDAVDGVIVEAFHLKIDHDTYLQVCEERWSAFEKRRQEKRPTKN